jgi:hypothetical protein
VAEHYTFPRTPPACPSGFAAPKPVDPVLFAFPAHVVGALLPPHADIPRDYRDSRRPSRQLFERWFYEGLRGATFEPRAGVDRDTALRHISACMRSFEPSHEHKEEGVAFLLELYFERVRVPSEKGARRG